VKEENSSKTRFIHNPSQLDHHGQEFLRQDPDLHWHWDPETWQGEALVSAPNELPLVELEIEGRQQAFRLVPELQPSLSSLAPLVEHLRKELLPNELPLLVAPELSPRVLAACKDLGLSALDLNGRAWLRAPGLLVDRAPFPGQAVRYTYELEPRDIFVGKSARLIRCLLTDRDRLWTQAELVPRIKASSGLVSRIVQHLVREGYLERTNARQFRLRDPLGLLDAWADSDRFAKRTHTTRYAGFLGTPLELAHRLQDWAQQAAIPLAFTQWIAAFVRHPYTEPPLASAYVSRLPRSEELEALGLRPTEEGGKLWLHEPDDAGLFQETRTQQDLTLTTDAQIYLDLQRTGLRGPEQAAALREWEGFCRL
jgi:hypothetical protein